MKARYVLNLAEAVAVGRGAARRVRTTGTTRRSSRSLTAIKGVGVWTAEMFLIFALNRPDVLPVGDLGVRVALRDRLGLPELPKPERCRALAEPWRPYRSVAMLVSLEEPRPRVQGGRRRPQSPTPAGKRANPT